MVAGTNTGSLLATALTAPSQKDHTKVAYYSDKILDIYTTEGPHIFSKISMNKGLIFTIVLLSILIGGVFGYKFGVYKYSNHIVEEALLTLKITIRQLKKKAKGKKYYPELIDPNT